MNSLDTRNLQSYISGAGSKTKSLTIAAIFTVFTAILQSAGEFTGIGFLFSAMATLPVIITTVMSLRMGLFTYGGTICLLFILQPGELILFPFTTGLLGLGLGAGLLLFKRRLAVVVFAATILCAGILILLYGLHFPVLGPSVQSSFNLSIAGFILLFTLVYSWLWTAISRIVLKILNKAVAAL